MSFHVWFNIFRNLLLVLYTGDKSRRSSLVWFHQDDAGDVLGVPTRAPKERPTSLALEGRETQVAAQGRHNAMI